MNDLVGGQIPMMMAPLNAVLPFIQDGKLFAIAVTDEKRAADKKKAEATKVVVA